MLDNLKKLPLSFQISLIVLTVVIVFYLARMIKRSWTAPKVNYNNIPVVGGTGFQDGANYNSQTGEVVKWDPDPLARELATNLQGWNVSAYPETVDQINKLQTSDQVILLYNHYGNHYAKGNQTLTQLIEGEWVVEYGSWRPYSDAVARLKGLGLN